MAAAGAANAVIAPMARLRFLRTTDTWHSWYPLLGLDRAMAEAGLEAITDRQNQMARRMARIVSNLGLMRNLRRSQAGPVFVAMMGYAENRTLPFSYWNELVPYAFDCWPSTYRRWASFFRRQRVRLAFFSARQSAEHFDREIPAMRSLWLPEAVDAEEYRPDLRLVERQIDIIELGRKHDVFHSAVVGAFAGSARVHRFASESATKIFPTRDELRDGLATSRVSVCFPRSMTHPSTTGGVETVTHRYFESMASGCLVIGHGPQELIDLFGYNPVVEVAWDDVAGQLDGILSNLEEFQERVDANRRRLLEVGTWRSRVPEILEQVATAGLGGSVPGA
jgi:hypothetical protein